MKKFMVMVMAVVMTLAVVAPKAGAVDHVAISGGTTWDCMGQYARLAERWYDEPAVTYGWWDYDNYGCKKSFTIYMELEVDGEVVETPFMSLEYNDFMQWLEEFDNSLSDSYYECYVAMSKFMCKWW